MKEKAFDLSTIIGITGGKTDRIISYIDLYIELASKEVTELLLSAKEENWDGVERTAHKMKAGAAYMGISEIKGLTSAIEEQAAAEGRDKESLKAQIELVEDIFKVARAELLEEKKRLEAPDNLTL